MKQFIFYISFFIFFSCNGQKDISEPNKEKLHPVYYLKNDLNSSFNLYGQVQKLSKMFIRRDTDSIMINVFGLPSYPLTELIGNRGFFKFDSLGLLRKYYQYNDSLDFVNNRKGGVGILRFYSSDSLPKNVTYKTNYSRNIIYPGMINHTEASETIGYNKSIMEANVDSLFYRNYFYKLEDGLIRYRLKRRIFPDGILYSFYEERVEYIYDSLNRIVKENYSYYEKIDPSDPNPILFRDGHEYHNIKIGGRDTMHKTYAYDEDGQITKVVMYINGNYRFEEKYNYNKKGNLISKIQIDPRWRSSMIRHRSYRTMYHYDQYGNITRMDMHNETGELEEQLWVDYYDFDKHNNWQRCEMFLNNTHEGEPTLTGYRRMTYYE